MATYDRARLNALIFHDAVVLPRDSAGFGEASLAVAELQGGNLSKAAVFAEGAVAKDPHLAAGWMAKAAADVFGATGTDLRTERALFCLERAVECAPSRRAALVEFFVSNLLAHYVAMLCTAAEERADRWMEAETEAWRRYQQAALLSALGMSAALTAFFAKRFSVRVAAGLVSGWAYVESARQERDAALAKIVAHGHRSASLLHLVPARDLIWLSARILEAEGLPPQPLEPVVTGFLDSFRTVLGVHLRWLESRLAVAIERNIEGNDQLLLPMLVALPAYPSLVHPDSEAALSLLKQVLPKVESVPEYEFLLHPLRLAPPTVSISSLPEPASEAAGCLFFPSFFGIVFLLFATDTPWKVLGVPFLCWVAVRSGRSLWKVLPEIGASEFRRAQAADQRRAVRQREVPRLHAVAARLWQVDTWLNAQSEQAIRSSLTP